MQVSYNNAMNSIFLNLMFSLFLISLGSKSMAAYIDLNYFSFTDQFTNASVNSYTRSIYDLTIGFEATNNKQIVLGLNSGSAQIKNKEGSSETSFTTSDLGLKFIYFWNKNRTWSTSLIYYFTSTAKYNDGTGTEVSYRGTGIKFDFGYNFWLSDAIALAAKIHFYNPSFKESVTNNIITDVSYKRTIIYPNFTFIFSF